MSPPKPATVEPRATLEPQRRPGKLRVAALLQSAAEVIAERGYDGATMAEIAARAGSPIGSLYRFFPNKDAIADALIQRYVELVDAAFAAIDTNPATSSTHAFADALLASLTGLRASTPAMVALLGTHPEGSARRCEFHETFTRNIVRVLRSRAPHLGDLVDDMAVVLLQNVKMMKSLDAERDAGTIAELRSMTRLYLESKLGKEEVSVSG